MIIYCIIALIKTAFKVGGILLASALIGATATIVLIVVGFSNVISSVISGIIVSDLLIGFGIRSIVRRRRNNV